MCLLRGMHPSSLALESSASEAITELRETRNGGEQSQQAMRSALGRPGAEAAVGTSVQVNAQSPMGREALRKRRNSGAASGEPRSDCTRPASVSRLGVCKSEARAGQQRAPAPAARPRRDGEAHHRRSILVAVLGRSHWSARLQVQRVQYIARRWCRCACGMRCTTRGDGFEVGT